jgi:DNA-binding NarL/FixJ family response regulator
VTKLRVFLADDHPIVRGGLRALLDAQPDIEVVAEAGDGSAAVRGVLAARPDVAVLDVSMPGLGGAEAAARIRRDAPGVRVLALSAHEDAGYVRQMLAAGASGYVVKWAAADELVRAVRAVAGGATYLDPAVADARPAGPAAPPAGAWPAADLSDREAEVLRSIARGLAIKQIAARLDVTVRTVETYRARGMEKLGLRTRADLVRHAVRAGWLVGG